MNHLVDVSVPLSIVALAVWSMRDPERADLRSLNRHQRARRRSQR